MQRAPVKHSSTQLCCPLKPFTPCAMPYWPGAPANNPSTTGLAPQVPFALPETTYPIGFLITNFRYKDATPNLTLYASNDCIGCRLRHRAPAPPARPADPPPRQHSLPPCKGTAPQRGTPRPPPAAASAAAAGTRRGVREAAPGAGARRGARRKAGRRQGPCPGARGGRGHDGR